MGLTRRWRASCMLGEAGGYDCSSAMEKALGSFPVWPSAGFRLHTPRMRTPGQQPHPRLRPMYGSLLPHMSSSCSSAPLDGDMRCPLHAAQGAIPVSVLSLWKIGKATSLPLGCSAQSSSHLLIDVFCSHWALGTVTSMVSVFWKLTAR